MSWCCYSGLVCIDTLYSFNMWFQIFFTSEKFFWISLCYYVPFLWFSSLGTYFKHILNLYCLPSIFFAFHWNIKIFFHFALYLKTFFPRPSISHKVLLVVSVFSCVLSSLTFISKIIFSFPPVFFLELYHHLISECFYLWFMLFLSCLLPFS